VEKEESRVENSSPHIHRSEIENFIYLFHTHTLSLSLRLLFFGRIVIDFKSKCAARDIKETMRRFLGGRGSTRVRYRREKQKDNCLAEREGARERIALD
jgi:hypothetical protein